MVATRWLRLAFPAAAIASVALALTAAAGASENAVHIDPPAVGISPGRQTTVALVADAPPATLAAWVIEVRFDPDIVSTSGELCDPLNTPPGASGAVGCDVVDGDKDGKADTVKAFGAVLFSRTGEGLSGTVDLADITFKGLRSANGCTTLDVNVRDFVDPEGNPTNPQVADGAICVGVSPPASTAPSQPGGSSPATPGSTGGPAGTVTGGTVPPTSSTGRPSDGASPGETTSPSDTASATRTRSSTRTNTANARGEEDGNGGSTLALIVVGFLILAGILGGLAWLRWRPRGGGLS